MRQKKRFYDFIVCAHLFLLCLPKKNLFLTFSFCNPIIFIFFLIPQYNQWRDFGRHMIGNFWFLSHPTLMQSFYLDRTTGESENLPFLISICGYSIFTLNILIYDPDPENIIFFHFFVRLLVVFGIIRTLIIIKNNICWNQYDKKIIMNYVC